MCSGYILIVQVTNLVLFIIDSPTPLAVVYPTMTNPVAYDNFNAASMSGNEYVKKRIRKP